MTKPQPGADPAIRCWPHGHATRDGDCNESIPDHDFETMERYGWGWVLARDDGMETGLGWFYACPDHRDDCAEEDRVILRQRNADAKRQRAASLAETEER